MRPESNNNTDKPCVLSCPGSGSVLLRSAVGDRAFFVDEPSSASRAALDGASVLVLLRNPYATVNSAMRSGEYRLEDLVDKYLSCHKWHRMASKMWYGRVGLINFEDIILRTDESLGYVCRLLGIDRSVVHPVEVDASRVWAWEDEMTPEDQDRVKDMLSER